MKHTITFITIALFISVICRAQDESWYKCLNGTIDKYTITMHLHKTGHTYSGYYFYNSKEEPVYFFGEDTTNKGKINLFAFPKSTEPTDEKFLFEQNGSKFTGEWKKNDSGKAYVFSAVELNDTSLIPFSFVYAHGETKLKPALKESPVATFEAASVWPTNNSSKALFVKKIISNELTQKNVVREPEDIFLEEKNQFSRDYKEGYKDTEDSMMRENPYLFSMDEINRLMIVYQSPKILSLANYSYAYTGGAHGNYGTHYSSLDLENGKKILLDNILTPTAKTKLPLLLEKYFRKNYGVEKNTSLKDAGLFESTIKPNDNFYVTGKGINFCYTPYEIGPYVMGEINIFIPFSELNNYLQPSLKKLVE